MLFRSNKISLESTWIRPVPYPGTQVNITDWPPIVNISQITIKHTGEHRLEIDGDAKRTKEEAMMIANRVVDRIFHEGELFEDVAREISEDQFRDNGGLIGWVKKEDRPDDFDKIWHLRIGEMTIPIEFHRCIKIVLRRG